MMTQLKRLLTYFLVVVISVWVLAPLVLITVSAFAVPEDYYDRSRLLPLRYTVDNVGVFMLVLGAWRTTLNSLVVAGVTIALSFLMGLPAGYSIARFVFPGRDSFKLAVIGLRMFPGLVLAVPLTSIYLRVGLADTLLGIALAHTTMALPFVVLITSSVFAGVPVELEEAGLVFGLSRLESFLRITLPLSLPGLSATAMFVFIMSWNEVFIASVLSLVNRTLPADILVSALAAPDPLKFAASFIIVVPALIFVLVARRYLVQIWGITVR